MSESYLNARQVAELLPPYANGARVSAKTVWMYATRGHPVGEEFVRLGHVRPG